ncbi:hypothetical protein B0I35DRAFT_130167 [Stachybotrys elegans]|uniref:Uncharacterized protein n=1 Tax=Stachybotrys elegans TaxID=80388 RepID=A0A8K0T1L2_9HYPO|nr:hypothetical protein B0I35DRAFT_130167 [Stachybotrys elegans]
MRHVSGGWRISSRQTKHVVPCVLKAPWMTGLGPTAHNYGQMAPAQADRQHVAQDQAPAKGASRWEAACRSHAMPCSWCMREHTRNWPTKRAPSSLVLVSRPYLRRCWSCPPSPPPAVLLEHLPLCAGASSSSLLLSASRREPHASVRACSAHLTLAPPPSTKPPPDCELIAVKALPLHLLTPAEPQSELVWPARSCNCSPFCRKRLVVGSRVYPGSALSRLDELSRLTPKLWLPLGRITGQSGLDRDETENRVGEHPSSIGSGRATAPRQTPLPWVLFGCQVAEAQTRTAAAKHHASLVLLVTYGCTLPLRLLGTGQACLRLPFGAIQRCKAPLTPEHGHGPPHPPSLHLAFDASPHFPSSYPFSSPPVTPWPAAWMAYSISCLCKRRPS